MKNEMMYELRRFGADFRMDEQTGRYWYVAGNREMEAIERDGYVELTWTIGVAAHHTKTTAHSAALKFWELQTRA